MFFFSSCHRIIPHDKIYVEQKESIGGQILLKPKQLLRICPSDRFCRVQNLRTSSVELIWPITELYIRQILSTDFMNRFYLDVKTGPNAFQTVCLKLSDEISRVWNTMLLLFFSHIN